MPTQPQYDIWPLDQVNYVERDEFIKKLIGQTESPGKAAEDAIVAIWNDMRRGLPVQVKVEQTTVMLAQDYIRYRDKGARLPKFGRWASGMFRDDKKLANDIAAAGKYEEKTGDVIISGDAVDILRCADTPHFTSCFKYNGGKGAYKDVPKAICENTPGIAIAYVDDDNRKMRGRVWVHHAVRLDTKEDVAVVCNAWAGSLPARQVAEIIKAKGIPAAISAGGGYGNTPVRYVNCFTNNIHHDLYTWQENCMATII